MVVQKRHHGFEPLGCGSRTTNQATPIGLPMRPRLPQAAGVFPFQSTTREGLSFVKLRMSPRGEVCAQTGSSGDAVVADGDTAVRLQSSDRVFTDAAPVSRPTNAIYLRSLPTAALDSTLGSGTADFSLALFSFCTPTESHMRETQVKVNP